jgi:small neutral amino acid transporter SnatA (MarC family)
MVAALVLIMAIPLCMLAVGLVVEGVRKVTKKNPAL